MLGGEKYPRSICRVRHIIPRKEKKVNSQVLREILLAKGRRRFSREKLVCAEEEDGQITDLIYFQAERERGREKRVFPNLADFDSSIILLQYREKKPGRSSKQKANCLQV